MIVTEGIATPLFSERALFEAPAVLLKDGNVPHSLVPLG